MRRAYLDNIRWATVLLVLVYHVFYMFNAAGVLGGVGPFRPVQYQDALLYFVYPWFMVLLFAVSGICARYALEEKSTREFIKSRTRKLLVPSTLGLLVFQWITGYFNVRAGGALDTLPAALRYPVFALSGVGPLWFIQMLWLFSLLLCLLRKLPGEARFYARCGNCGSAALLAFALVIWGAAQVLNAPVITTYRFGIYLAAFLLGYFVLSHEAVQQRVEAMRVPLLLAALICGIAEVIVFWGESYAGDACLKSPLCNVYAWLAVLAILGCARAWCNRTTAFSAYMTRSSFGIYIVHYLLVIAPCYLLKTYTVLPPLLIYVIGCATVLLGAPLLYELLRRIPLLRYLVLGISKKASAKQKEKRQV